MQKPKQFCCPGGQGAPQTPPLHDAPGAQAFPQPPQFEGSLCGSTQVPEQSIAPGGQTPPSVPPSTPPSTPPSVPPSAEKQLPAWQL